MSARPLGRCSDSQYAIYGIYFDMQQRKGTTKKKLVTATVVAVTLALPTVGEVRG
jgi:hypothetical protein